MSRPDGNNQSLFLTIFLFYFSKGGNIYFQLGRKMLALLCAGPAWFHLMERVKNSNDPDRASGAVFYRANSLLSDSTVVFLYSIEAKQNIPLLVICISVCRWTIAYIFPSSQSNEIEKTLGSNGQSKNVGQVRRWAAPGALDRYAQKYMFRLRFLMEQEMRLKWWGRKC